MNKAIFLILIIFFFTLCGENVKINQGKVEDYKTGKIRISIDESFKPVFEEIIKVFRSSYPDADLVVEYKSEAKCIADWYNDSVRLIICTKRITPQEYDVLENNLGFKPSQNVVAYDALALIVNKKNKDSLLNITEIKSILNGSNKKYSPIVEGLDQSSSLRYIKENILHNEPYSDQLKGAKNAMDMMNNVADNKKAVGFIGVSWIGDKNDTLQINFNKKVSVVAVECRGCDKPNVYVKPYQVNLYNNHYPFLREISYVLKENYVGLGRGFVNFLSNERGQLLFKKSYLVPAKINFNVRHIKL